MNFMASQGDSPEELRPAAALQNDEASGTTFGDIVRALNRGKWLILTCTLVCLVCALLYVLLKQPLYEASASIRIDPTRAQTLGFSDLLSPGGGGAVSSDQVPTEIAVLESDAVALAALESLTPDQFRRYANFEKQAMRFTPSDQPLARDQEDLLASYKKSIGAKQVEGTQLVGVTFRSPDPKLAATLLKSLIDAYMRQNFESRYDSVLQVRSWLGTQMDQLRDRAADAQKKLADFQERNNLLGTDPSNNTVVDRLKLLNTALTEAESNRILKEAQMRAAAAGDPAVLASLLPDPQLQALQQAESTLYVQYTQLATKFGSAYPPLVDVKKQLAQVQAQIQKVVAVTSSRLHVEYDTAERNEAMLRKEYASATEKAYALNRTQADYAVLAADGASTRNLYDQLQGKLQQASVGAGLNSVNMMVVDPPRVSSIPAEPKKALILVCGLALGLVVGISGALLREATVDTMRNVAEVERQAGLVTLACVPHLPAASPGPAGGGPGNLAASSMLLTLREPGSRGAEAYRSLLNAVQLSSPGHPPRTILVTSPGPQEGKTLTCANYAVTLARRGSRVLVVDADLRRPALYREFKALNEAGLADQILGGAAGASVQTPLAELPNLHFLPAGSKAALPSDILGSPQLRLLLSAWEKSYDIILLDSAPILTVSDTLPLASWVDGVIVVVRAEVTQTQSLLRAKTLLARAKARIAGIVLNDVSPEGTWAGGDGRSDHAYYQ